MLQFLSAWVPIVQGITATIALGIGGYVALVGLSTWKQQLRGKANAELARRVLLNVYKVRDAVRALRGDRSLFRNDSELKMVHEAMAPGLENTLLILDADMLEVEALWGTEEKSVIRVVDVMAHILTAAIWIFGRADQTGADVTAEMRSTLQREQRYPDEFDNQLDEAVRRVEELAVPFLRLGPSGVRLKKWFKTPKGHDSDA